MVTLTEYEDGLPVEVAFPPVVVTSLAEIFSALGWRQFHVAETEKYAHVTYFFNGGVEAPWPGEDRLLVPSPKVATYDLQPEMSAAGVTDALVAGHQSDNYDFIVANYANPDMVGHTGFWDAAVRGGEFVDGCLARSSRSIDAAIAAAGGRACCASPPTTAMPTRCATQRGNPMTAHSLNPVPLVLAGAAAAGLRLRDGVLADVAPTLLELVGVPVAEGMTGRSLIER